MLNLLKNRGLIDGKGSCAMKYGGEIHAYAEKK